MINIKLSPRLEKIVEKIPQGTVLFDVGTDHAYLPCAVVQRNICKKAYASDLREGPLEAARKSISRYGLTGKVIPILSDGIAAVCPDVDCLVIAGMGYDNVFAILNGKNLSRFKRIILQINRKTDWLRSWIAEQGYLIVDEELVAEEGRYYEIVVLDPNRKGVYSPEEIVLGPCLLNKSDPLLVSYWQRKVEEWKRIDKARKNNDCQAMIAYTENVIKKKLSVN